MSDGNDKLDWRVGLMTAIACGVLVYILERARAKYGNEEGIDLATAMYDFGSRTVKRIADREIRTHFNEGSNK